MVNFKINIHAHSIFSDGRNSPYHMAMKAKELGFCCLVITDHWYPCREDVSLTWEKLKLLRSSVREAEEVLPVIIGLELPVAGEEILVFGEEAIRSIAAEGNIKFELSHVRILKKTIPECAYILCHPRQPSAELIEVIDGYELGNSGQNWIDDRSEKFKEQLSHLPAWSNSDAHMSNMLTWGFNQVNAEIKNETDLISYIKSRVQPTMYLRGKEVSVG